MIDELRHLLLIVDAGTYTAAARQAHLSQPAMTAAIQRLELAVGGRLLERDRRGARPTAAGLAMLPHARAAVASVAAGIEAVARVQGLSTGHVRIGAGATACTWLMPPTLAEFRANWSGIRLTMLEATTAEICNGLSARELDLGIVTGGVATPFDVVCESWLADELVVVATPERAHLHTWVAFRAGSPTRAVLDRYEPAAQVAAELGTVAAVKAFVLAGMGRALLSRTAVGRELRSGELIEVPTAWTPQTRNLDLAHRGVARLSPAATRLREHLLAGKGGASARSSTSNSAP